MNILFNILKMPQKRIVTRNRAKIEILHYILQFSTCNYFGLEKEGYQNVTVNIENCFKGGFMSDLIPEIGSLCIPTAVSSNKWYLSWLRDTRQGNMGKEYLLESIEDGSLCWFYNIGIFFYPKTKSDQFPHWQFSDDQFDFWDKWKRVFKKRNYYLLMHSLPIFNDDGSVILRIRKKFSNDIEAEKLFDSWKKLTQKEMLAFYDETEDKMINKK